MQRKKNVSIWESSKFQEELQGRTHKTKLYVELMDELANAGFTRTLDQIIINFKNALHIK